jgi:hypothetical protein
MKLNPNNPSSTRADDHSMIHSEFLFYAHDMNIERFTRQEKEMIVRYYDLLHQLLDENQIKHRLYKFDF